MHLMIVENDNFHRSFVRNAVETNLSQCEDIVEAEDGKKAIELAAQGFPDCVILDLEMPETSGVDVARFLWSRRPDTKIVFWSNHANEAYIRGLSKIVPPEAIYGYVLKSEPEESLLLAINGVFSGNHCVIDRKVRGIQQRTMDRNTGLSDVEYESLLDIALGLTDKAVAVRRKISPRSAQSRLTQLYQKLGVERDLLPAGEWGPSLNSRTRVIGVAFARGLITAGALQKAEQDLAQWFSDTGQTPL